MGKYDDLDWSDQEARKAARQAAREKAKAGDDSDLEEFRAARQARRGSQSDDA
jgi:hypothetical protein